ncbi:hypothetical protein WJX77_000289 [Trebouxia sp. C0004]
MVMMLRGYCQRQEERSPRKAECQLVRKVIIHNGNEGKYLVVMPDSQSITGGSTLRQHFAQPHDEELQRLSNPALQLRQQEKT